MALIKTNARSASALDATILTGNLPAISGASLTGVSAGKVLQVVQGAHTNQASMSSSSYVDVSSNTNVSLACASTSNKVLVMANFHGAYLNGGARAINTRVTAGGTEIMNTDYNMYIQALSSEQLFNSYNTYLYHPNSTSSIEYKLQFLTTSNTDVVRMNQNNTKYTTIILLEIEG